MRRFIFFALLAAIVGCSNGGGSSSGGGNNPTSDTGGSGLSVSGSVSASSMSVDCWSSDCDGDGTYETLSTQTGTYSVTVYDTHSQYTSLNQGVTFTQYTISYSSSNSRAPSLASRTINQTMQISLAGASSVSTSFSVETVPLETIDEFARKYTSAPSSLPITYTATFTFYGKDWITNSDITTTVTVNLEFADYCQT